MRKQEQIRQLKTLLSRLDSGMTVDAGGHLHNPMSAYVDPDLAARERAEFFTEHPQMIGLSGDLPEPGSFLTLNDLAVPILATRTAGGEFKAFVNACRHRGVVVEDRPRGETKRFTCPFHSWSYATDGALVGVPKKEHFGEIDPQCHGLVELPAVERYGLLWVHQDPNATLDIDSLLGEELADELDSWGLGTLVHLGGDSYEIDCNWKLAMDTFGETYHFSSLHKDTLYNAFHGNVQCYDTFGRHHRMLLCKREIDNMRLLPEDEWHVAVGTLPVYWLFPNVQLMPSSEGLYLVRAYPHPTEPGRHTSIVTFYLWPRVVADAGMAELMKEIGQRFAEIIRDEDYVAGASQQRVADSGALTYATFGRNEPALHHYHNTYREVLGLDTLPLVEA
ncbi:MAG: aromatic ring-hydroxylating dioxygenase subunit alpha [Acidimicrobiia bacterium]|nr:aromatic ring-hydroxylating dioxygenase subunit alpha [Acidimicrobiia bacterium]